MGRAPSVGLSQVECCLLCPHFPTTASSGSLGSQSFHRQMAIQGNTVIYFLESHSRLKMDSNQGLLFQIK